MNSKEIISKAAKFIDEKKYDEFQKMNFGNDDMASITDNVLTLEGIEYLDKKGLIPEEYFSKKEVIFNSSPEQVDFYISKGARVNDSQKFWNYEDDCEEEMTFLDLIVADSRYSSKNVESVIKAGGKFSYDAFDIQSVEDSLRLGNKNTLDKIKILNKANMLDEDAKESIIGHLGNIDAIAQLANPQQEGSDYLALKAKILREKLETRPMRKTAPLGKSGDVRTGEVREEHKNIAGQTMSLMKALMTERVKGKSSK